MNLYTVAFFLHVSGAIGAFISLGLWLFGLFALQRAKLVEQVRALLACCPLFGCSLPSLPPPRKSVKPIHLSTNK